MGRPLAVLLALLTIFGPLSMDLYLPLLPALTLELETATSMAQLTITACLIGLALGQVVAGPASDRFGRRTPLLIGVVAYVVTSVLCAISPTVELLILARFVQGLAGGVGIVISQAAGGTSTRVRRSSATTAASRCSPGWPRSWARSPAGSWPG
ncbi:hypothetical protein GCM10011374_34070 [Kocuria dechangensis]|uniref:Major facilitator superfamily (MFS) profile domain-containing protein n=1 Tax=Kocuria dechangensis TaxID=1176249 RepID=A0A917M015_9MICC|nr:hypothetical protein GCM10011374_34070 [Kocuria dechangensis]